MRKLLVEDGNQDNADTCRNQFNNSNNNYRTSDGLFHGHLDESGEEISTQNAEKALRSFTTSSADS